MSKWIDLPSNSWNFPECFEQPLMPNCHLIYDIFIIRCGFIVHAPATIDELKLFVSNKLAHQFSTRFRTVNPPVMKKSNFHLDELSLRVFLKFINHRVYDLLYTYPLIWLLSALIVLFKSAKPTNIVMRMRDKMNGQQRFFIQVILIVFAIIICLTCNLV